MYVTKKKVREMRTCRFVTDDDGDNIDEMSNCKQESKGCPHFRDRVWCPYYSEGTPSVKERMESKNDTALIFGLCVFACVIAFMIVIR
jgi:hypothetical protein